MPGDEQKNMNRAENHVRSAIISWSMSLQTTTMTQRDIQYASKNLSEFARRVE